MERLTPDDLAARVTVFDVDDLTLWEANPNRADTAAIHSSMEEWGQIDTILVATDDQGRRVVVDGNHRVAAERSARRFGGKLAGIDVTGLDWSDVRAFAAGLALNRTARLGEDDPALLADLLAMVRDEDPALLRAMSYTDDDLSALLDSDGSFGEADNQLSGDLDEIPDDAPAITKPGDIWRLGPHRVMAGDCRDADDVARLLNGVPVNLAFTSPPYASQRTYDETSGFKPIPPDNYVTWFEAVQANIAAHLATDGSWFVNIKEHADDGQRVLYVKDLTLAHVRRWRWMFVDELAWTRGGVPGTWPNRFKNGWEPVFHFAKHTGIKFRPEVVGHESDDVFHEGGRVSGTNRTGNVGWNGGDADCLTGIALPSNVINIHPSPASMQDADHPAAFPVDLPRWFVKAYTDPGDTVYDPFVGSGSTILAAHQERRIGYGMEISPKYCDTICARWQRVTGVKPVRDGQAFDFTQPAAAARKGN